MELPLEIEMWTTGLTALDDALLVLADGAAKLKTPNEMPNVTSMNAAKIRGLKNASLENEFFFMVGFGCQPNRSRRALLEVGSFRSLGMAGWL